MKLLEQVQRGQVEMPRRTLLYGTHGIGKSTFGAMADAPIFVQTEDGLASIDCDRLPLAECFGDVLAALGELHDQAHDYKTVVVDSVDWLERLIFAEVCRKRGVESIEELSATQQSKQPGSGCRERETAASQRGACHHGNGQGIRHGPSVAHFEVTISGSV